MTQADLARSWLAAGLACLALAGVCVGEDRPAGRPPSLLLPGLRAMAPSPQPGAGVVDAGPGSLPVPIEGPATPEPSTIPMPRPFPRVLDRPIEPVPPPPSATP